MRALLVTPFLLLVLAATLPAGA
ncbi:MAG: hypothetical protein RL721_1408, partial [Candidatus Eisenbacteria bacterium]